MVKGAKNIFWEKKRWVWIILSGVILCIVVPKFIYYLSVQVESKRFGVNSVSSNSAIRREYFKKRGGKYLMVEAKLYCGNGRYRMAVRAYKNIAKKYPKMAPAALYEITRTYELSGSSDSKKIKAYQEVIRRFPDSREAEKSLEGLTKLSGNPIPLYQDLIREYPDKYIGEVALAAMVNNVLEQQRKEEAQKLCLKWLVEHPAARVRIAAYKHLVRYAQQSNNIEPVTDFSYRIIEDFPQGQLAEAATLFLAGIDFQKGNYNESLCLWSDLEKKKKIIAEKTQPETYPVKPEGRKVLASKNPDIYQRSENLARAGSSSPGYIKELANIFFISGEVCDTLASYSDRDFSDGFFADAAKDLFRNRCDLKKKPGASGFTAEERSLLRDAIRIRDGKVVIAYQELAPTIGSDKVKSGLVRYLSAYILATRSASQVAAEMDIFLNEIPMEFILPALLGLVAEAGGYQYGLNICREIIERSPQNADVAVVLENSGNLYQQMKMNADAIKVYKEIVLKYPEDPLAVKAQEKIIDIYALDWKMYPKALTECFELTRIFPGSAEAIHAQLMVGRIYYLAGNYDQAIAALQGFVSKYPRTEWVPEADLLVALNYLSKQENNLAVGQLRMLISKYPKHELASRAQFLIGYSFLFQQKYNDALREYQKLCTNYPESPYVDPAKDFIRRLSRVN
ncbi:MAG: tetratricopeptide repeat protein [Candidatus Omnitrophica bacterium]|nr:tetratricopeptide repeat protein [Candidatus Omnitrophota bacterium]